MKALQIFVLAAIMALTASAAISDPFKDVADDAVYYEAITELSKDYELGYPDNTFRPEEKLTRAECLVLMIKLTVDEVDLDKVRNDQIFVDVPTDHWARKYITYAYDNNKIIEGYGNSIFDPDGNISVSDMAKIFIHLIVIPYDITADGLFEYHRIANVFGLGDVDKDTIALRWQAVYMIYKVKQLRSIYEEGKVSFILPHDVPIPYESDVAYFTGSVPLSHWYYDNLEFAVLGVSGATGAAAGMDISKMKQASYDSIPKLIEGNPYAGVRSSIPLETEEFASAKKSDDVMIGVFSEDKQKRLKPGTLTAGKWNDLDNWLYWQGLMNKNNWSAIQKKWNVPITKYEIFVYDAKKPVIGAKVKIYDDNDTVWSAVTDNKGRAILVCGKPMSIQSRNLLLYVATTEEELYIKDVILKVDEPYEVNIKKGSIEDSVDVMFVIDTTGSMRDELEYLKVELNDLISRIPSQDVRVSCNFYRDVGDEYIVRPFPFTTDLSVAIGQISEQRAKGGGDFPESVELALINAIDEHEWNAEAKEHFLFLVLDAPPHHTPEIVTKINYCIQKAAEKGIRVIPVASSGIDKETEFLLRSMAIATNGVYVFLTDHSGVGNDHIEPTNTTYSVEFLNDLLVQIMKDRL